MPPVLPYKLMRLKKAVPGLSDGTSEWLKAHEDGVLALGVQQSYLSTPYYLYVAKAIDV